jgi:hypothetical protein
MSAQANRVDPGTRGQVEMEAEPLERAIRNIELGLIQDDLDFVRRLRRHARAERTNTTIVVLLLVTTVLLLSVGLATYSWFMLVAGASAFVGAFAADDRHRRLERRSLEA